jgi:ligand-binding SRPBCC domain-containing protein
MQIKRKEWQQFIPQPVEAIWDFFSRPENLKKLTPIEDYFFDLNLIFQKFENFFVFRNNEL